MPKKAAVKKKTEENKKTSTKRTNKQVASISKSSSRQPVKSVSSAGEEKYTYDAVENAAAGGKTFKIHKLTLVVAFVIILLGVLLYFGRGFIVAAVVNGQPISRVALVQETEKASGKQAMASLIRNTLVEQEAQKTKITVSEKEINDQIKTIEGNLTKQGQKLDQMLALEGMTRDDLHRIIRLDILVTKLVGKDINISDKQVSDYIAKNKDLLPKGKSESQLKADAKEALKKQQLPQKAQGWFAELEKKAKIVKFVDY